MPLHNSMWGYPIGVHPTHDKVALETMASELTEVSGKLSASTKPTTTQEVGLGDEAKMGPYHRVCGGAHPYHFSPPAPAPAPKVKFTGLGQTLDHFFKRH